MKSGHCRARFVGARLETLERRTLFSTMVVSSNADSGPGSLREAIDNANASPGADEIDFQIEPGGPTTIALQSPLPTISDPLTIDGTTQTGYAGSPLVELTGYGLSISAGSSTVRGLVIHSPNGGPLITLTTLGGNVIQGCYLGTTADGTAAGDPGEQYGIYVNDAPNNTIGGTNAADGNVISGCNANPDSAGIFIFGADARGNVIRGNRIGTTADASAAIPNHYGIRTDVNAAVTTIAGNVISGNSAEDIYQTGTSHDSSIQNNFIGTNSSGAVLSNNAFGFDAEDSSRNVLTGNTIAGHQNGIYLNGLHATSHTIQNNNITGCTKVAVSLLSRSNMLKGNQITGNADAVSIGATGNVLQGNTIVSNTGMGVVVTTSNTTIGGTASGSGNTIASNGRDGIDVTGATSVSNNISGNSIYSNGGLGIDLGANGTTKNDSGDADSGPNNLQNFPLLGAAIVSRFGSVITGALNSTAGGTFRLEFFSTPPGTGTPEGRTYLGTTTVTTGGSGNAQFTVPTGGTLGTGQLITATATDSSGNTSEFSAAVVAANPAVASRSVFYNDSAFDGNDSSANPLDDSAIAPDKQALLLGGTAAFANYTSYSKGINGIMIDVANLLGTPRASDFSFRVGNDNNPAGWSVAPAPNPVVVRPGAGVNGATRVEITWPDGAIRNEWLQVTMKSDAATGLATPDVFYFGNAIGESGTSITDAIVDVNDELAARADPHNFRKPADLFNPHDYNRDGRVDATDQLIARNNGTDVTDAVGLISVPATPSPAAAAAQAVLQSQVQTQTIGHKARRLLKRVRPALAR
jgi:parallel beta-helix repeat protein